MALRTLPRDPPGEGGPGNKLKMILSTSRMRIENLELSPGHPEGAKTGPPPGPPTRGVWGAGAPEGAKITIFLFRGQRPRVLVERAKPYLGRFFVLCLAPLPRVVPGEGPDCHCPEEIVGFGPIPARIRGFLISILALFYVFYPGWLGDLVSGPRPAGQKPGLGSQRAVEVGVRLGLRLLSPVETCN